MGTPLGGRFLLAPLICLALAQAPAPAQADTAVFVGAGDIASCSSPGDEATAALLDGIAGTVFTLGDNAYQSGTLAQFTNCYGPSWGRHKARTRPAIGNHEYLTPGARGYFDYFGEQAGLPDKGYYSFDLGDWHIVALNSMCTKIGGCGPQQPMAQWLTADLAANPSRCTLAYFHHPLFSSGTHGGATRMRAVWRALFKANADIVLNGHEHMYERFAPQDPNGNLNPSLGIRQFIVGTGGASHSALGSVQPNSEVRNTRTYGVLKLTLNAESYSWEFIPAAGSPSFQDSGGGTCH